MTTNELIERLRSKRPIDLETLSDLLEEAADCIEGLKDRIAEKQKHLENLQKVNEDLEERIAIMTEHGLWIPVEERLPEKCDFYLVRDFGEIKMNGKKIGLTKVMMFYPVEKQWEKHNEDVTHWMPIPKPPKEGEAE